MMMHNTFGDRLVDSDLRNIRMDTSSIITTAVLIDSLETSGKQVVLAGRYLHPVWGKVSAASYIPYLRPEYSTEADVTVLFDSLMLYFRVIVVLWEILLCCNNIRFICFLKK